MNCNLNKSAGISGRLKIIITFLIILSLALAPAGCNSNTDAEDEFLKKYETLKINNERVSIKFYFPGEQPKAWDEVRAEIEKELADTVNVSLDFKWLDFQSYYRKIKILDASEEPFDAFCIGRPQEQYPDFTKLAREGRLKDISQLFPDNAPALMRKYSKEELDYASVDGKLYTLPSLYPAAYCPVIWAADSVLKKYGIEKITTYDEYEEFLGIVKNNEPDLIPGTIRTTDTLKLFAAASGYAIADETQKLVYKWDDSEFKLLAWENTPEFKEYAYTLAGWFKNGYLKPIPDPSKLASVIQYNELYYPFEETLELSLRNIFDKTVKTQPMRQFYLYPGNPVQRENPMGFDRSFAFPALSSNTERAIQFLDWVQYNQENYYLVMFGREGIDYMLKNNYPTLPEGIDTNNAYMNWDGSQAFTNIEYLFPYLSEKRKELYESKSQYPPHGAFYPDFRSIEAAARIRNNLYNEFNHLIYLGKLTETSQVDNFIQKLEKEGSANLVEIAQKQLDEVAERREK
ncbi:MAG: hypothetical protein ABFD25_17180 [Clostridiaceae bacterium]